MMAPMDLNALPPPQVVQEIDFEAIAGAQQAELARRAPELAGVLTLESEPLTKLVQAHAYREMLYRERVNQAARANLLAYATGTDLDHKGAFYGCARLQGESDERFRLRITLRIASLAGNGTKEGYEYTAMSLSLQVRSALAIRTRPGYVQVLVWPAAGTTEPETLRKAVQTALDSPTGHALGVMVTAALAREKAIDITAHIYRSAMSPVDLLDRAKAHLANTLPSYARLGRSVPRSWISAQLHAAGASAVRYPHDTQPAETTALAVDEFPVLGVVKLTEMGLME